MSMNPKPPSDPNAGTLAYYDQHANEFIERTAGLSMAHLYEPFLALVPAGGRILDAGCGSGRDAAEFARRGFSVTAFDGSAQMARLASERSGLHVLHLTFEKIAWRAEFDGVWACASLLHVPSEQVSDALDRLVRSLRPGGVLFVSVKAGNFEGQREGRWFSDRSPSALHDLLADTADLEVIRIWEADDVRPGLASKWVNSLAARRMT
jgi:2-polyprenyl-3-methyl-5-hydroxy-6-metoxy-1,4-benzoquinol methylase